MIMFTFQSFLFICLLFFFLIIRCPGQLALFTLLDKVNLDFTRLIISTYETNQKYPNKR